jgi:hypothetical protein
MAMTFTAIPIPPTGPSVIVKRCHVVDDEALTGAIGNIAYVFGRRTLALGRVYRGIR